MADPSPELDAYAPPKADTALAPSAPVSLLKGVTRGTRIAGALLLTNAIVVLAERVLLPQVAGGAFVAAPFIDAIIGISLLLGRPTLRVWALVRCVLGGVVFVGISVARQDYVTAGMQAMLSGSLIALLIGDAGLARIIISCVLFGICMLLELIDLVTLLHHQAGIYPTRSPYSVAEVARSIRTSPQSPGWSPHAAGRITALKLSVRASS
jgi:hypothetical protein